MKICIKCKIEKGEEEFPLQHYKRKDGSKPLRTECKSCMNRKREDRRKRNGIPQSRKESQRLKQHNRYHTSDEVREKARLKNRLSRLKNLYGMSLEDYDNLLKEQDYKCVICGVNTEQAIRGVLDVDHCHTTGKIRGLLCTDCNNGLGRFKDNIEVMQKAIQYLRDSK